MIECLEADNAGGQWQAALLRAAVRSVAHRAADVTVAFDSYCDVIERNQTQTAQ